MHDNRVTEMVTAPYASATHAEHLRRVAKKKAAVKKRAVEKRKQTKARRKVNRR